MMLFIRDANECMSCVCVVQMKNINSMFPYLFFQRHSMQGIKLSFSYVRSFGLLRDGLVEKLTFVSVQLKCAYFPA